MPENKRVKISSVVKNQLPDFIRADFPLAGEFLAQYYTALEGQGSTLDVLQNIDKYIKVDELADLIESTTLSSVVGISDNTISVESTTGFPDTYGLIQIDSQRLAYFIKWQGSYFAITNGESRRDTNNEQFYIFNEPAVGSKKRLVYEKLIQEGVSPVEMHEFFKLSSFEVECETICGVITRKGIVNVIKAEGELRFNKSLH